MTNEELRELTRLAMTTPPRPRPPAYLTFHSPDGEFTLGIYNNKKSWDGTLEWSTDKETWTEWDGTTLSSSDEYLYMRGTGNSHIAGNQNYRWVFTGGRIECLGNIENLLDHTLVAAGEHPSMSNSCYDGLFYKCENLIKAPDLRATTLTENCYASMFGGCTSLERAPKISATTLARWCCIYMFYGCTSLTSLPNLKAASLTDGCYGGMFLYCTGVRLSTVSDTTYRYAYRIPTSRAGTTASDALAAMFTNTGGPFTGDPEINTTYYTDHEPV